jgi:hypothetical protein
MLAFTAVIAIVGILEIRQMVKEKLKKEIILFVPLAVAAIALAWVYTLNPEASISRYFLSLFGIAY